MDINVLGPLSCDGHPAFGRRDRAVLTALAVCVGRSLSVDRLSDAVWGDDPPASAHKSLQGCIVRLRRVLGPEAIKTSPQGYRLEIPCDEIDARRFERLVVRSRELLALGEPDRAAYTLANALELWRGRPFEDVDSWELAVIEAGRLDELRLEAEELRVDAMLRSGRHLDVLAEAQRMVRAETLRERRWTLLALAQYQAGRQTEALRTVQRIKTLLAEKLGLDPGHELASLELAILRQDDSLLARSSLPTSIVCPYRGLTAYDVDDSEIFFGRAPDVHACLELLRTQGSLAVVGRSGSGKSSLVRAGVAAALAKDGAAVRIITPGEHPVEALARVAGAPAGAVLVVDQCEEAVSRCGDESERTEFFAGLVRWSDQAPLAVALSADRLAEVSGYGRFGRVLGRGVHVLGAMSDEGLRDAVELPARQAGLLVEPGLVDLLVTEVGGNPGALPLMSHALQETWKRREAKTLTVAGYAAGGGVRGAVARSAEQVYGDVAPEERPLLRDLLLRLANAGAEGEPVRTAVPRRRISEDPDRERLTELLVGSRLVTSDAGVVELTHEAVIRAWPRLRSWLDEDADSQRVRHHLASAADAWDSMGRPSSELYRGTRLARALEWRTGHVAVLTATEAAFLAASADSERCEPHAGGGRSSADNQLVRRLLTLLVVAVAMLVAAVAALVVGRSAPA